MGLITQIGADASVYNKVMGGLGATANNASNAVSSNLAKAGAAAAKMGGAVAKGSDQAAFALTNLGRVAQDAPFGFIGIQNNLNPLLESFQRLKAESGSTGGAIKALVGSLTGAAGLGLALSVVTSAFTFYTMWQQKAHKGQKDLTDATKDYVSTLDSVHAAQLKGQQDGEQELIRARLLYSATQNHSLSMAQRNAAYDELSKKYEKWFPNAEREKTLLGENKIGYDNLAIAILAAANAKAYEQKIGENSNRAFEDQMKKNDALAQNVKLNKDLLVAQRAAEASGGTDVGGGGDLGASLEVIGIQKRIAANNKVINDIVTDQTKLYNQNQQLIQMASDAELAAGFKTTQEIEKKTEKLKEQADAYKRLSIAGNGTEIVPAEINFGKSNVVNKNLLGGTSNALKNTDGGMDELQKRNSEIKRAQDAQDAYNQSLRTEAMIISDIAQLAGTGLTSAFESILTGTQSLVSAMGQFLGQLITKLLAAAAAAAVLAVIISVAGFGSGIGAGVAAAGSFKNLFSSFSGVKLAEGGITNGPTRALIGEGREREAVMPLSKLQSFVNTGGGFKDGQIVGVLQGDKLLLQYQRASIKKGRVG